MEIIRAKTAGFCMGVIAALRKLDLLIEKTGGQGPIYTLGPIIHNPQVLAEYAGKGVIRIDTPEAVPRGVPLVIRAHGIPRQVRRRLLEQDILLVDATCPKVRKAQLLIGRQARRGRMLLLFGEANHPEVSGLLSYAASGAFVFDDPDDIDNFCCQAGGKYCLAAQTTQNRSVFDRIAETLKSRRDCEVKVLQTICDATRLRQEEAERIAGMVEYMVVVGGFDSGNTRRLVQIVAAGPTPVVQVEEVVRLPLEELRGFSRIGLTAGASTPQSVIDEVERVLRDL